MLSFVLTELFTNLGSFSESINQHTNAGTDLLALLAAVICTIKCSISIAHSITFDAILCTNPFAHSTYGGANCGSQFSQWPTFKQAF